MKTIRRLFSSIGKSFQNPNSRYRNHVLNTLASYIVDMENTITSQSLEESKLVLGCYEEWLKQDKPYIDSWYLSLSNLVLHTDENGTPLRDKTIWHHSENFSDYMKRNPGQHKNRHLPTDVDRHISKLVRPFVAKRRAEHNRPPKPKTKLIR